MQALQTFADSYGISVADLEYLLALDSEAEALLVRTSVQPPTVQDVIALYNQWVFEAALCNASSVHFVLDCSAQLHTRETLTPGEVAPGLGAVIKRLCYLARKLGVYYDLSYEQTLFDGSLPGRLLLTLYGPQDVTGLPQQYGLRLARLCRLLLDYGSTRGRSRKRAALNVETIVEAVATVHFLQRSYNFVMNADLLQLLPAGEQALEDKKHTNVEVSTLFDSTIEQQFAEAFMALTNSRDVDGWRLEREPEPLLLEQSIFIPDFALTRGQRRIYVEILGFWTPAYRERKIQKLHQLRGRNDLLLAIPLEAKAAFASIEADFPIVFYVGQLAATDILHVLRSRYNDFSQRLELIDSDAVREHVHHKGLLLEQACYELLHCYRRSELAEAVQRVQNADVVFVPGFGFYHTGWMAQFKRSLLTWLRTIRTASLSEIVRIAQAQFGEQVTWEDTLLESLLVTWPEIYVNRASIFDTRVELIEEMATSEEESISASIPLLKQESRKQVRERRTTWQKRKNGRQEGISQEGLWNE